MTKDEMLNQLLTKYPDMFHQDRTGVFAFVNNYRVHVSVNRHYTGPYYNQKDHGNKYYINGKYTNYGDKWYKTSSGLVRFINNIQEKEDEEVRKQRERKQLEMDAFNILIEKYRHADVRVRDTWNPTVSVESDNGIVVFEVKRERGEVLFMVNSITPKSHIKSVIADIIIG